MRALCSLLVVVLALGFQGAIAEEIYRTEDTQGNVTFTDTPPADDASAQRVELPPGPSPKQLEASQQRNREILRAAERAQRERVQEKRQQLSAIDAAKQQLQEAENRLSEAKVIRDEDRQNLAGGKRRIHPDYFDRVRQAEAAVEAARKALREARGY